MVLYLLVHFFHFKITKYYDRALSYRGNRARYDDPIYLIPTLSSSTQLLEHKPSPPLSATSQLLPHLHNQHGPPPNSNPLPSSRPGESPIVAGIPTPNVVGSPTSNVGIPTATTTSGAPNMGLATTSNGAPNVGLANSVGIGNVAATTASVGISSPSVVGLGSNVGISTQTATGIPSSVAVGISPSGSVGGPAGISTASTDVGGVVGASGVGAVPVTTADTKVQFEQLKSLADLGIDTSFLNSFYGECFFLLECNFYFSLNNLYSRSSTKDNLLRGVLTVICYVFNAGGINSAPSSLLAKVRIFCRNGTVGNLEYSN